MTRSSGPNAHACSCSKAQKHEMATLKRQRLLLGENSDVACIDQCPHSQRETGRAETAHIKCNALDRPKRVIWWLKEECEAQNKRRAKALRRSRPRTIKQAMKLQKRIVACSEGSPCDSAACVICTHRLREQFIPAATTFFGADHRNLMPVSITIIPANERVSYRRMDAWDLPAFVRRMKARLNTIPPSLLICAAGAVDISLNRDRRKRPRHQRYRVHFVPHLHLAGLTPNPKQLARHLRALFPADPVHVKRPTRVRKLTPDEYAVSYFMRLEFDRRTHKTDEDGEDIVRKDPLRTGKKDPLTGKSQVELQRILLAIGKDTPMGRVFFFRCRLILDGPSAPAITLIQSPPHTRSRKMTRLRHDRVYSTRRVKR